MEAITLPAGVTNTNPIANTSRNVGVESFASILQAGQAVQEPANQEGFEQEDVLRDVLKRTADLLSVGDRGLKFEMVEDADMYQLQVIDMSDGRVVRKIPPDEVMELITHLKEQISDHVDVLA